MRSAPDIDPSRIQRILIVKMSSIGDVVQALPVATALRRRYPQARISWVVEDWTAPLVVGHPAIDRVVVFPRMAWGAAGGAWLGAFKDAVRNLKTEPYDVCLDLQGLMKSSVVGLLSGARLRFGGPLQREGAGFVSRNIPCRPGQWHAVDEYLQCAEFLGASAERVTFDLPVRAEAAASVARRLSAMTGKRDAPLVIGNPSASATRKDWPAQRWVQVVDSLAEAATVLLIGDSDQRRRHTAIAQQARRRVHDLTGSTTLAEAVALLDQCALHIAPDSGTAHIAAALGRPVVGIYGPTPPRRLAPYGQSDRVLYRPGLCGVGCPRLCLHGRRCLRAITPEAVIEAARRVLTTQYADAGRGE